MSENRNQTEQPKKKLPSTAFKPGQSGNPGGRPKKNQEVKEMAEENSPRALQVAIKIMLDEKQSTRDRLTAVNVVLDRGLGKPAQAITGADGGPLQIHVLTDQQLQEQIAQLKAELGVIE